MSEVTRLLDAAGTGERKTAATPQQSVVAAEIGVEANNKRCDLSRPTAPRAGGGRRLPFHQDGFGAGSVLFKVLEGLWWTPRPAAPSDEGGFHGGKAALKVHVVPLFELLKLLFEGGAVAPIQHFPAI
jgi:hypothetical protein